MSFVSPSEFQGSVDDYKALLRQAVLDEEIREESVDDFIAEFNQINTQNTQDILADTDRLLAGEGTNIPLPSISSESISGREITDTDFTSVSGMLTEDLEKRVEGFTLDDFVGETSLAQEELNNRQRIVENTFLENLTDPTALRRMGLSTVSGLRQVATAPNFLAALALKGNDIIAEGIGDALGQDFNYQTGDNALSYVAEQQRDFEEGLGVTPPITATESFLESIPGAFIPGGIGTKVLGISGDFLLEQSVRELTDDENTEFQTVFDQLGVTNDTDQPALGAIPAIALGILGGSLTASGINRLNTQRIERNDNILRPLSEVNENGPEGLMTSEHSRDLTNAMVVDEQEALISIMRRNGLPNITDIENRIEFDTHSAARTRVQEGYNTGRLTTRNATFQAPTAPKVLTDAYNALSHNDRALVSRYINLADMRDDARIAISNNQTPGITPSDLTAQMQQIANTYPLAVEFSNQYNGITKALREFGEGSLFSQQYRMQLDRTRPNYVPLELSNVDPDAPLLQRLSQAQTSEGTQRDFDWFLQNRDIGNYNLERRQDPFDMLQQSVEATLNARMRNDTNVAIVDGLLSSEVGSQTIRKATSDDDLNDLSNHRVDIYRNGESETYLTTRLTASLMKYDPYIAQYPLLFIPKRVFEQAAVGPLSITFAPVTAIRDAIGGRVTRPDGLASPSLVSTVRAVPEQLWQKAQGAIANRFQQSFVTGDNPLPTWLMSEQNQQNLANNMADAYSRSLYHQANEAGGYDASLMRNNIQLGENSITEAFDSARDIARNIKIPGIQVTAGVANNIRRGLVSVFNSIQDAPRFAAIKETVEQGASVEDAVGLGRQLTGDVTRSGRVFDPEGNRLQVDAVDQGVLNLANKPIGQAIEFLRESTPFLNPMIQGNKRLLQSIVNDPIGFNTRAWLNIGLPSLALYGWNEMLGQEYNDYAMQRRSARDVAMNMYIGLPDRPPEEGLEIPLMHELLAFSSPFTRSLYGISRGESQDQTSSALAVVAKNIFENSLEISFPIAGQAAFNVAGINGPESFVNPSKGVFQIREDNVGILPENMERLTRTLFASVGDTVLDTATAFSEDQSFSTVAEQLRNNTLSRLPVVDGPLGLRTSNTQFSIPDQVLEGQWDSVNRFREIWDAYYNLNRFNDDGLEQPASKDGFTNVYNPEIEENDLPFTMLGPEPLERPINPLYEEIGDIIVDEIQRNNAGSDDIAGMSGLVDRERVYNKYLSQLRDYHSGNGNALQEWQAIVEGIVPESQETLLLQELLSENAIDISNYEDRVRLINIVENERANIINGQAELFSKVEDRITEILAQQGFEGRFSVKDHLDPNDPNPLGN